MTRPRAMATTTPGPKARSGRLAIVRAARACFFGGLRWSVKSPTGVSLHADLTVSTSGFDARGGEAL